MKLARNTLLVATLATLAVPAAFAQGVNLYWNDCGGGTNAAINQTFACDTNVGDPLVMFLSVVSPYEVPQFVAVEASVDVLVSGGSLPPWWQLGAGQCRDGAMRATCDPNEFGTPACPDIWDGAQPISVYQVTSAPVTWAFRFRFAAAVQYPSPISTAEVGQELVVGLVRVTRDKSTGPGACDGCLAGACFVAEQVKLMQPAGLGDLLLTSPATNNWVQLNGGIGWQNCYVPNVNRTWGAIKTLYR